MSKLVWFFCCVVFSMKQVVFFSVARETWCSGVPCAGDLKCEGSQMYQHDGRQWRKQCLLCSRLARPRNLYCRLHSDNQRLPKKQGSSLDACRFLDRLETEIGLKVMHRHFSTDGVEGSEFRVANTPFRSDGFTLDTNIIIEVLGDFWHGNPSVFDKRKLNHVVQKTFDELHRSTFQRFATIVKQGYRVFYVWEANLTDSRSASDLLTEFTTKEARKWNKSNRRNTIGSSPQRLSVG